MSDVEIVQLTARSPSTATAQPDAILQYEVKAERPRLNRKVLGDVVADVDGIPAEPVHSFVWDGDGSVAIEGSVRLEIDPVANSGEIVAEWTDRNGDWTLTQTAFAPPDHADGLRVGSSGKSTHLLLPPLLAGAGKGYAILKPMIQLLC